MSCLPLTDNNLHGINLKNGAQYSGKEASDGSYELQVSPGSWSCCRKMVKGATSPVYHVFKGISNIAEEFGKEVVMFELDDTKYKTGEPVGKNVEGKYTLFRWEKKI